MNLLEETIDILKEHGLGIEDIRYIQGYKFGISIENFIEVADFEYDNDFGSTEVAEDLVIVGDYWWLERHEYEGSEWWEFKTMPKKIREIRKVERLAKKYGGSLEKVNQRPWL